MHTVGTQVACATGDSLVRMLLGLPALQQPLAAALLQRLLEYGESDCEQQRQGGTGATSSVPLLIMGQLRWCAVPAVLCRQPDLLPERQWRPLPP